MLELKNKFFKKPYHMNPIDIPLKKLNKIINFVKK